MESVHGVHPRLITSAPGSRLTLAMLPALNELSDDFAWAFWYSVRRACDGAERVPLGDDEEAGLMQRYQAAAEAVGDLEAEMQILCAYACGRTTADQAAKALATVAEWAAALGLSEPAIQAAEAAAALAPHNPSRVLTAGRLNRLLGDQAARAELYYERAIPLARRSRNWRSYVRAHLGKGHVKMALGDPAAARAHFYTAARAARVQSGEKWLAAQTQHDLLILAAEQGEFAAAVRHAQLALDCYPRHHAAFPGLVHDVAFLMVRLQMFTEAVPLLKPIASPKLPPQEQVIAWSTLAHATAGMGDAEGYSAAADNTLRLVGLFDLHAASAFANLACGAQLLKQWREAEQYARRSLAIAEQRREPDLLNVARDVLKTLGSRHPWHAAEPRDPELVSGVRHVGRILSERIAGWRGATWKRKRQSGREDLRAV